MRLGKVSALVLIVSKAGAVFLCGDGFSNPKSLCRDSKVRDLPKIRSGGHGSMAYF